MLLVPVDIDLDELCSFRDDDGGAAAAAVSSSESMISVVSVLFLVILFCPSILTLDGISRNIGNFFITTVFPSEAIDACDVVTFTGKFKFKFDGFTTRMGPVDSFDAIVDVAGFTIVCLFDGDSGLLNGSEVIRSMVLLRCRRDVG